VPGVYLITPDKSSCRTNSSTRVDPLLADELAKKYHSRNLSLLHFVFVVWASKQLVSQLCFFSVCLAKQINAKLATRLKRQAKIFPKKVKLFFFFKVWKNEFTARLTSYSPLLCDSVLMWCFPPCVHWYRRCVGDGVGAGYTPRSPSARRSKQTPTCSGNRGKKGSRARKLLQTHSHTLKGTSFGGGLPAWKINTHTLLWPGLDCRPPVSLTHTFEHHNGPVCTHSSVQLTAE